MAKNLTDGSNIVIEEDGDNINLNLSSTYTNSLNQTISDSFKNSNIYSTTETVIGKWIDNKPLYRKIIDFGALPNNTTSSVSTGYAATDITITKLQGTAIYSNGITIPIPNVSGIGVEQVKIAVISSGEIAITTYNDRSGSNGYITLEYTKASD